MNMGRVITNLTIKNGTDPTKIIHCDGMVDTGASITVLPMAWKEKLGKFDSEIETDMKLANGSQIKGLVCGPASIKVSGFRPVFGEIMFMEMTLDEESEYEPLIGYVILESIPVAVDMLGHRLVPVKFLDCK